MKDNNSIDKQKPASDESPAEKLDSTPEFSRIVPGAENADSEEIKDEEAPNTE